MAHLVQAAEGLRWGKTEQGCVPLPLMMPAYWATPLAWLTLCTVTVLGHLTSHCHVKLALWRSFYVRLVLFKVSVHVNWKSKNIPSASLFIPILMSLWGRGLTGAASSGCSLVLENTYDRRVSFFLSLPHILTSSVRDDSWEVPWETVDGSIDRAFFQN